LIGIGDDAAAIAPGSDPLVWTIDAAVEGVHFRRDWVSFGDLGFRATMAAASDLAAMGARPLGILASLVLPADVGDDALEAIAQGQRAACDVLGTAVLGGNLARGGELSITTTVLGESAEPMRRDGARVGDALWIAGAVGLAAAGLALIESGREDGSAASRIAVQSWRRPQAQIDAGLEARSQASAAIDVSDGLVRDVGHIARASGIRAVIDPAALCTPELVAAAALLDRDPIELALYGGEDYALIVAAPAGAKLHAFKRIGGCEPIEPGGSLVAMVAPDGSLTAVADKGFDHFEMA
jgi:thiamine-monophosphate kinase